MYNALNDDDFVYYKDANKNIFSGGYKITNNRFLENDIASLEKPSIFKKRIEDKQQEIVNINNYVQYTIKTHLGILEENGFISCDNDEYIIYLLLLPHRM